MRRRSCLSRRRWANCFKRVSSRPGRRVCCSQLWRYYTCLDDLPTPLQGYEQRSEGSRGSRTFGRQRPFSGAAWSFEGRRDGLSAYCTLFNLERVVSMEYLDVAREYYKIFMYCAGEYKLLFANGRAPRLVDGRARFFANFD